MDIVRHVDEVNRSQSEQLKKLTIKIVFLEKELNERIKEEQNTNHMSFNEESIKTLKRLIYDKGLIDNFLNRDPVFEPNLVFKDDPF